jgi:hypothetical protein
MNEPNRPRRRRGPITLFCESRRFRWSAIACVTLGLYVLTAPLSELLILNIVLRGWIGEDWRDTVIGIIRGFYFPVHWMQMYGPWPVSAPLDWVLPTLAWLQRRLGKTAHLSRRLRNPVEIKAAVAEARWVAATAPGFRPDRSLAFAPPHFRGYDPGMSEEPKKLAPGAFWPFLLLLAGGIIAILVANQTRDLSALGFGLLLIGAACLVIFVTFVILVKRSQGPK